MPDKHKKYVFSIQNMLTRKKKVNEIHRSSLKEIVFTKEDEVDFGAGIHLFNEQHFWHAHECWEKIWQRHSEDERIFFQGIIQLAAAYHHLATKKSFLGMMNNFEKAKTKLELFPKIYLGINVAFLLEKIDEVKIELLALTEQQWSEFDVSKLPQITLK